MISKLIAYIIANPTVLLNRQVKEIYDVENNEYLYYSIEAVIKESDQLKLTVVGLSTSANYRNKLANEIVIDSEDLKKGKSIGRIVCFKSKGLLTHLYLKDPDDDDL